MQRSSPQTAAHIQTTFLSLCSLCGKERCVTILKTAARETSWRIKRKAQLGENDVLTSKVKKYWNILKISQLVCSVRFCQLSSLIWMKLYSWRPIFFGVIRKLSKVVCVASVSVQVHRESWEESKTIPIFFGLPLQLSCKTQLETLAAQAMPIGAAIFKTVVVWQFFFS